MPEILPTLVETRRGRRCHEQDGRSRASNEWLVVMHCPLLPQRFGLVVGVGGRRESKFRLVARGQSLERVFVDGCTVVLGHGPRRRGGKQQARQKLT